jgi:hypothetical protein
MAIQRRGKILKLTGTIGIEEAEIIYAQFEQQLFNKIDLSECVHLHCAILQLIVVFKIPIQKYPSASLLNGWLKNSVFLFQSHQEA